MIAVRYSHFRLLDGRTFQTYQGRAGLPSAVVETPAGPLTALRPVGYAEVEVPGGTHPDEIRRRLAAEFAAGRWWVYVSRELPASTLPPVRSTVGLPLAV